MNQAQRVKDVMSPDIMTVADDMTTDELARYLTEHEISGAPVVDAPGHLARGGCVFAGSQLGRAQASAVLIARAQPWCIERRWASLVVGRKR